MLHLIIFWRTQGNKIHVIPFLHYLLLEVRVSAQAAAEPQIVEMTQPPQG